MGINIVTQTNEQECGICALTALHNHFYSTQLSKEQVLNQCSISDIGLTIFDFETLANKLGLECESYEVKWAEFLNLKINNYFVLLLATAGSNNHYVIAKKKKGYVEVYDSASLQKNRLTYNELKQMFVNVLILIKKHPNELFGKLFSKQTTLLMFDLKFVLLNLGLSILIMGISIISATLLNYVIDLAIGKQSINNLITICFIFILFYLMNDILSYISNLYMSKHIKNYFILFTSKILNNLENKKFTFFNKVDKNWIFKIDECVYHIADFSIVEINKFITNIVFWMVCICIISSIQYYLLIFAMLHIVIELIFFLFAYKKKQEVFLNIVRSENNNANYYKQLITSLSNEIWMSKRKSIIGKIKNNYSEIYKNYSDVILFKGNSALFKSILKSICEIAVIAVMSYFVIKDNNLSVGKLVFVISAFSLYKSSVSGIFDYFLLRLEFNIYWQVYKDLTAVDNWTKNQSFSLKETIHNITFDLGNQNITLDTKTSFNVIGFSILDLFKRTQKLYFNSKLMEMNQSLINSIIICDQHAKANVNMLVHNIELDPQQYSQYIRYFNLDLNKSTLGFYDELIINLLSLISVKNHIIFIDDVLRYVCKKDKVVVKQIINKIKKHNTVFVTGKEEND